MVAYPGGMEQVTDLVLSEAVIGEAADGQKPESACCHYWIIETANGPVSRGQCQNCHETKNFKNSVYDTDREEQEVAAKVSNAPIAAPEGLELTQNALDEPGGVQEPGTAKETEAVDLPETVVV